MKLALKHEWLFARIEMGLTKKEFLGLSPADYQVAVGIWKDKLKRQRHREDELVARVAYFNNLATVYRKEGDATPSITDFMPQMKAPRQRKLTPAELQQKTEQLLHKK